MKNLLFIGIVVLSISCQQKKEILLPEPSIIAFGSCNHQDKVNPMWQTLLKYNPQHFIWLGDNIYGDTNSADMLSAYYKKVKAGADYQEFLNSGVEIIGTWDDHDYGANDAGKEWPIKEGSKRALLEFLDVPETNSVWEREGVYMSYTIGELPYQIRVILLDTRWFRDQPIKDTSASRIYGENPDGDVLGAAQWEWLENELKVDAAEVTILASSIQFLANDHGFERWGAFPKARQRMFDLIKEYKPKNLVILSGDRHIAEVSKTKIDRQTVYDITTSGMTHVYYPPIEPNTLRDGPFITSRNAAVLTIDWSKPDSLIKLDVVGEQDSVFYQTYLQY